MVIPNNTQSKKSVHGNSEVPDQSAHHLEGAKPVCTRPPSRVQIGPAEMVSFEFWRN